MAPLLRLTHKSAQSLILTLFLCVATSSESRSELQQQQQQLRVFGLMTQRTDLLKAKSPAKSSAEPLPKKKSPAKSPAQAPPPKKAKKSPAKGQVDYFASSFGLAQFAGEPPGMKLSEAQAGTAIKHCQRKSWYSAAPYVNENKLPGGSTAADFVKMVDMVAELSG